MSTELATRSEIGSAVERKKTGPVRRPILDRFLDFVSPEPNTGCWLWTGATSKCGYGRFGVGKHQGGMVPAHRVSFALFHSVFDSALEVAHRCDVRICVNPEHLWLATHQENMADMKRKGRMKNGRSYGDRNGSRTKPESRPRGDNHWTRRKAS